MYSIDIMVEEHENIRRMLRVVQKMCCEVLEGKEVEVEDFRKAISFVRNYADAHHHGKEEKFLFPEMLTHMGELAKKLITHGMLVEHDLGRSHILGLETALNQYETSPSVELKLEIITEAMGYARLLQAHIEKENTAVFVFAKSRLPKEVLEDLNVKSKEYEEAEKNVKVREKYLSLVDEMEKKYSVA